MILLQILIWLIIAMIMGYFFIFTMQCMQSKEKQRTFKKNGILIPPGEKKFEQFQAKNWIYLEWVVLSKENSFFKIRPAIEYKIIFNDNGSKLPIPFFLDFLEEQQVVEIQTVKYIFYQDGEEVEIPTWGNSICFGKFALQALELAWITSRQIEAG